MGILRTIGNKMAGRAKTVDKALTEKELVDLLETHAIIEGGREVQRANVKYVDSDAYRLKNVSLFDVKKMFLDRLSTVEHSVRIAGEYTDITHQVYSGKKIEKHYVAISHGSIKHKFGRATESVQYGEASIEFEVKKGYVHPHSAPPA